jgi:hypothetical protein
MKAGSTEILVYNSLSYGRVPYPWQVAISVSAHRPDLTRDADEIDALMS